MAKITSLYSAKLLILWLNPFVCAFWNRSALVRFEKAKKYNEDRNSENFSISKPTTNKDIPFDQLSWRDISPDVSDILSEKIFSQSDPVSYLIEETVKLPRLKVFTVKYDLALLIQENKLPKRYVPYAEVLSKFADCRSNLHGVTRAIRRIRSLSISNYSTPDFDLGSNEICQLFSSDIFSDKNVPFQLLIKLINIPMDKIASLSTQFESILFSSQLPQQYSDYAKEMMVFLKRELLLSNLVQSVAQLRDISAIKSSIFDHYLNSDRLHKKPNVSSTTVPQVATSASPSNDDSMMVKS